ncbi:MAG: FAD-dependent oxidoreductase [Pseudomonadota bacterium]
MAPIGIGGLTNPNGSPGIRAIEYYLERARGNVGLIITSNFKVENDIDPLPHGFMLVTRAAFAPFAELAEAVHAFGARIFVQLTAGFGRVALPAMLRGKPVSASPIPNFWDPRLICKELTLDEIERIVKAFGVGAAVLAEAGIDGIELHGHEGYLFDQFTTKLWNKRSDRYGGDLAGRLTFPLEVLKEIKQTLGWSYPVQYRFGLKHYLKEDGSSALPGEEYVEAGRDLQEGLDMAKLLEQAGFDALHVDAGCYESWYWPHPPSYQQEGCMTELAAAAKKVVTVPVIAVGRLDAPELAEKVISEGKADIVAIGKGLLADPHWVRKVEEGRAEDIRPCIACHDACMGRLVSGKPISCAVNPSCGRERSYAIERSPGLKHIIVVGGGVAGLEAARVASIRGHKVDLYEKSDRLGGHVEEALVMPFKTGEAKLLNWYKHQLDRLSVDIHLNMEVGETFLIKAKADTVILATGSQPMALSLPEAVTDRVVTAIDLLTGKRKPGEKSWLSGVAEWDVRPPFGWHKKEKT